MTGLTGKTIRLSDGADYCVGPEIGRGGQGICYSASKRYCGERGVLKQLLADSPGEFDAAKQRAKHLVESRLSELSPLFHCAPNAWHHSGDFGVVHFSRLASGKSLETLFDEGWSPPLLDVLQLGLAVAGGLVILHEAKFAHGDLQGNNLFVEHIGTVVKAAFIDFCNYWHPKMPALQPCIGQELFLAPEQRVARLNGSSVPAPDVTIERFSLGVFLHQLILLRHPGHSGMNDPTDFHHVMTASVWGDDPARNNGGGLPGGYPPNVLNVTLQNLFRRLFAARPDDRPSAKDWVKALDEAVREVFICPRSGCGGPIVIDRSKTICPFCSRRYPDHRLVVHGVCEIPIDGGGRTMGRYDLGGASTISNHHANLERFGPELRLVNFGRNGTFRWGEGRWIRLPDATPVALLAGDRLRFADAVEASIEQVN